MSTLIVRADAEQIPCLAVELDLHIDVHNTPHLQLQHRGLMDSIRHRYRHDSFPLYPGIPGWSVSSWP